MSKASYQQMLYKKPWYESWKSAKRRCSDPGHKSWSRYGGRGIQFLINKLEVQALWVICKAYLMERPRLDRENVNGHYCFSNCRFIPEVNNLARVHEEAAPDKWED